MSLEMKDVRSVLEPEEPDYDEAAKMGSEALPHLEALVKGNDIELAAKAASLAGIIAAEGSMAVLNIAAKSHDPVVRVAAAGAARDLSDADASQVLETLIGDADIGVQKTALKSIPANPSSQLKTRLTDLSGTADVPAGIADSVRKILVQLDTTDESGRAGAYTEMPDIQQAMPGFDAAASVDEDGMSEGTEEREMPGFDESGTGAPVAGGDMPGYDTAEDMADEQKMPGFDEAGGNNTIGVGEQETLEEMPEF